MLDVSWLMFTVASLVLIVTPGQDMVLVMSRSVAQGPTAGVATAAGVSLGLPQFVRPEAAHPTLSVFVLGLPFAGLTLSSKTLSASPRACCRGGYARVLAF